MTAQPLLFQIIMRKTYLLSGLFLVLGLLVSCSTVQQAPQPLPETPITEKEAPPAYPYVEPGEFDNGKMWTFEFPPIDYFRDEYGLEIDSGWMDKARLATVRLPNCTASFVSPTGLVLTNHHCTRDEVLAVTLEGENLTDDGFYALTIEEERQIDGYYLDQLIEIIDVTDAIYAAIEGIDDLEERLYVMEDAKAGAQERITEMFDFPVTVEIIALYNGALYSAYVFKRFDDVRLVMAPELNVGYFGGDPDNFTYPRYSLDMAFLRVYVDGAPYQPEHWFNWSHEGVRESDPVFVVGNPGSTSRLKTVAQLEYIRDVDHPVFLQSLREVNHIFTEFLKSNPEEAAELGLRNYNFQIENAAKAYTGGLKALQDDNIMGRRLTAENRFRDKIRDNPELAGVYGSVHDEIFELNQSKREVSGSYKALFAMGPGSILSSGIMQRAILVGRAHDARIAGNTDAADYYEMLIGFTGEWPMGMERMYVTYRINRMLEYFDEPWKSDLRDMMGGRDAEGYAAYLIGNTILTGVEETLESIANGGLDHNDPAVLFGLTFAKEYERAMATVYQLGEVEEELERQVGLARYAVYGTTSPPDATFSLRLQDGRVVGYDYNGTVAPPYTTFYGKFDRHFSHNREFPWSIDTRWFEALENGLDLSVPLNFVSTNDIIGGNSGSPILNAKLELVGLVFDGNIESLSGDFIYTDETARSISVDARGMFEALRSVYRAERIVNELTQNR